MYTKIYFDNKPLFLCDSLDEEIVPYAHHDDTVFIDELSTQAVNTMIHEMQAERVHAGIYLHPEVEKLKKMFWKKFAVIVAAGGLVINEQGDILFILRRSKWDLPKGKLEAGESIETCAVREVEEETGVNPVSITKFLLTTYHTYHENGKHILKESHWYAMVCTGTQEAVPQVAEDITEVRWVNKDGLHKVLANTFPLIVDVLKVSGIRYQV
jgi:8-oxo-dGTP pyrophosphatase MutT (NUDIX family)